MNWFLLIVCICINIQFVYSQCSTNEYYEQDTCWPCPGSSTSPGGVTSTCLCPTDYCGLGSGAELGCHICPSNSNATAGSTECICNPGYIPGSESSITCTYLTCNACAAGYTSTGGGSTTCTECPFDTYSLAGSSTCTSCPVGFQSPQGSTSISECICTEGNHITGTGATATCSQCTPNTYSGLNYVSCVACPTGSMVDYYGASTCFCNVNFESIISNGVTIGCTCPAGYAINSTQACNICQPGQYSTSINSTSCATCPVGAWSSTSASTTCTCNSGFISSGGGNTGENLSCTCAAGYYISGSGSTATCASCQTGCSTCINNEACSSCPVGYGYYDGTCTECPIQTYSTGGVSSCTPCPSESTTTSQGSATCTCNSGYYTNGAGSSLTCTPCPANSTYEYNTCTCLSTYIPIGSTTYRNMSCVSCNHGFGLVFEEIISFDPLILNTVAECFCNNGYIGTYCNNCANGYYQIIVDNIITCNIICPPGYASGIGYSTCDYCDAGYFYYNNTECIPCPANSNSVYGNQNSTCECNTGYYYSIIDNTCNLEIEQASSSSSSSSSTGSDIYYSDTSSGEELSSSGEELSSSGEELSSSGEELSSSGEELSSSGEELSSSSEELSSSGAYSEYMSSSTSSTSNIPTSCNEITNPTACDNSVLGCEWIYGNTCEDASLVNFCPSHLLQSYCQNQAQCEWILSEQCTYQSLVFNCYEHTTEATCLNNNGNNVCKWGQLVSQDPNTAPVCRYITDTVFCEFHITQTTCENDTNVFGTCKWNTVTNLCEEQPCASKITMFSCVQ
jgi:hypothetical protein